MLEMHGSDLFGGGGRAPETLSKKGFAERIGVSPGRVSQLVAAGLPVEPNGRIHVERGTAWVAANIDPNRRRATLVDDGRPAAPLTARAAREQSDAEIARLKAERMGGRLIDRQATLRTIEARARAERDAWIGWVQRAAPDIARAAGADLATVVATLDRLVREHLARLADLPLGDLDRE